MPKIPKFEDTKAFKIIKERWGGQKDMEQYFIDKNKEFIEKLKDETKTK
jgi:hypothetical protein